MWRYVVGGLAALLMVAGGIFLFKSRAAADHPFPAAAAAAAGQEALPDTVPAASDKTREQKRFDRLDKDRNDSITRDEYFLPRHKAFAKLDVNHDGVLSFDEWAVKAVTKFAGADKDKSGALTRTEFATTAMKRNARARCACQPQKAAAPAQGEDEGN